MGRTNVEVNEDLIEIVKRRYGVTTKREAIDLALRRLAGLPLDRRELEELAGARLIDEVPQDVGPRG